MAVWVIKRCRYLAAVMSGQALSVTGQIDLEDLGAAKTRAGWRFGIATRMQGSTPWRLIRRAAMT